MYMSDDEIRASYRTAADQKAQIKVLAELNACSAEDMREKLTELGFSVGKPRKKTGGRVKLTIDELRAMELYDEGLTDLQIAETLGVPEYKIGGWRRMMRLKKNGAAAPEVEDGGAGAAVGTCGCLQGVTADAATGSEGRADVGIDPYEENSKADGAEPLLCGETASPAEEAQPVENADPAMTSGELMEVLQRLEKAYPDHGAYICTSGGECLCGVEIRIKYDRHGLVSSVSLVLQTE